jgi:hypothetical protein
MKGGGLIPKRKRKCSTCGRPFETFFNYGLCEKCHRKALKTRGRIDRERRETPHSEIIRAVKKEVPR